MVFYYQMVYFCLFDCLFAIIGEWMGHGNYSKFIWLVLRLCSDRIISSFEFLWQYVLNWYSILLLFLNNDDLKGFPYLKFQYIVFNFIFIDISFYLIILSALTFPLQLPWKCSQSFSIKSAFILWQNHLYELTH